MLKKIIRQKIVLLPTLFISLIPLTAHAKDIEQADEFNRPVIQRNIEVKTEDGKKVIISQKFLKVGGDELFYIKGSSSAATIKYGQDLCQAKGQVLDIEYGAKVIKNTPDSYVLTCSSDKNIVNTITTRAYSTAPVVQKNQLFTDTITFNDKGEKIIERVASVTGVSGKKYKTGQKFIELKKNKLLYIPNSSTPETLEYANAFCKASGSKERINKGSSVISSLVPVTVSCEGNQLQKKRSLNSTAEECNVTAYAHSTDARPNTNVDLTGSFYYSDVTFLNTKISFFDYYNEIEDANQNISYGNAEILLKVLAPSQNGDYPFTTTGTTQKCSNSAQGTLAVF